jgi:Glycosyltransferase family 87
MAMADPTSECGRLDQARRLAYWMIAIAFIATAIVFSIAPLRNAYHGKYKDYELWGQTGRIVLDGGELYPTDGRPFPFMYPPTAAVILAVLWPLGSMGLIALFSLVNTAAWLGSVLLSVKLASGRVTRQDPLLYLIPSLIAAVFVWLNYLIGQPNLFLLLCMLIAMLCLFKGREGAAGAMIALAASIKAFPIMAVGYLVYRRHWRAVASLIICLVVLLVIVPAPFRGFERNIHDLKVWSGGMLFKYDKEGIAQRPQRGTGLKNSSLIAVANRLLRHVDASGESKSSYFVNVADLDFHIVNGVIAAVGGALCVFYVACMPRRRDRTDASNAIEAAMLLLLILVFSPFAFTYFFVWLIYPFTLLLHLALAAPAKSGQRRVMFAVLVAATMLLALPIVARGAAQARGNNLAATLLLLAVLGWRLRQMRRKSVAAANA